MDKTDFRKELKSLFNPPKGRFAEVDVPDLGFLMIDGLGDPSGPDYARAVEALYSVAYPLKFMSKAELGRDYVVAPLEGLWWADDLHDFVNSRRERWRWTMMIMQPDWITPDMVARAKAKAANRKANPDIARLRLERYREGRSLHCLHIGPYSEEAPVLHRLHHELMPSLGLTFNGKHHEIYLSDPRRTEPARLKTILRQPVRPINTDTKGDAES